MIAILMSIKPKWCELIASGKKTIEVRKTRPKIEPPFVCYIYETKGSVRMTDGELITYGGEIIGEFVCDDIKPIRVRSTGSIYYWNYYNLCESCLSLDETAEYIGREKTGYAWHISDLKIYDEPKELSDIYAPMCESDDICTDTCQRTHKCSYTRKHKITRAPQSWCYVEEL